MSMPERDLRMCFREDALTGRHIIISGGCGAIGIGVVKKLTDHGASVTVNDILAPDEAEARFRPAEIRPDRTGYIKADLTQAAEVESLVQAACARFVPIHTALCHAGMAIAKPLMEFSDRALDRTMSVNVRTAC